MHILRNFFSSEFRITTFAMASSAKNTNTDGKSTLSKEQMVSTFNELRQQQRLIASRMSEIEMDMKEHDLVLNVLKDVDPKRKCYRLIGGVLVERNVDMVLPGLTANRDKMKEYTDSLRSNLEAKGNEMNEFRKTHGLQIKADDSKDDKDQASSKAGDRQATILAGY